MLDTLKDLGKSIGIYKALAVLGSVLTVIVLFKGGMYFYGEALQNDGAITHGLYYFFAGVTSQIGVLTLMRKDPSKSIAAIVMFMVAGIIILLQKEVLITIGYIYILLGILLLIKVARNVVNREQGN